MHLTGWLLGHLLGPRFGYQPGRLNPLDQREGSFGSKLGDRRLEVGESHFFPLISQASQISMTVIMINSMTSEASILLSCSLILYIWIYWTAGFATGAMSLWNSLMLLPTVL